MLVSMGMLLPAHEQAAFFRYLAAPCGGGRIEFFGFSNMIRRISELPPLPATESNGETQGGQAYATNRAPVALVEKIKAHLLKHHPSGLSYLFQVFHRLDREGRGYVTHREYYSGLKQCGLRLGTAEVERLLGYFDFNRDGHVTYPEFLSLLRGNVPQERYTLVEALWERIAGGSHADAAILERFSGNAHPAVTSGKSSAAAKEVDFAEYLGEHLLLGKVPKNLVISYFIDEGVSIEDASEFDTFVNSAFP